MPGRVHTWIVTVEGPGGERSSFRFLIDNVVKSLIMEERSAIHNNSGPPNNQTLAE